jgi:hypothetical protein
MATLESVKNYLDITWPDENGDVKLCGLILSGESYLARKAGIGKIDFDSDPDALMLLKDYVRYARSNAMDEFEPNYLHELIGLREKYQAAGDDTE